MTYIKEEIENIKNYEKLLNSKLENNFELMVDVGLLRKSLIILNQSKAVLEERKQLTKIDNLIKSLPVLYIHIGEILNKNKREQKAEKDS